MTSRTVFLTLLGTLVILAVTSTSCSGGEGDEVPEPLDGAPLLQNVESNINVMSTVPNGEEMPGVYTCYGLDRSPPISWSNIPDNTQSLTLIVDEPNSPEGPHRVNWVVYNLPPDVTELPPYISTTQETANGGTQGRNHTGRRGWTGPCPEKGGENEGFYTFNLYALDIVLDLAIEEGAQRNDLIQSMTNHVIGHGSLMSKFCRTDAVSTSASISEGSSGGRGSCPPKYEKPSE